MVTRAMLPDTLCVFVGFLAVVASSDFNDAVIRAQCQAECLHKVGDNNYLRGADQGIGNGSSSNRLYPVLFCCCCCHV